MPDKKLLEGKFALITGASRGIGQGIAVAFAAEGARLALTARSLDDLNEVSQQCKEAGAPSVDVYQTDLTDSKAVSELADKLKIDHGGLDVLVNNAGMMAPSQPIEEGSPDAWEKMIQLNLNTPMRLTHAFIPLMEKKGGGDIINISSIAGIDAIGGVAAYAASKWGLTGWSRSVAQQMKDKGVRLTSIHPAVVESAMTQSMGDPEKKIRPEDIAQAALLPFRMSPFAVPEQIVVRNAVSVS